MIFLLPKATSHDDLSPNNNWFIIKKDIIPAHFSITPFVRIQCLTVLYVLTVRADSLFIRVRQFRFVIENHVFSAKRQYGEDRTFCHLVWIIKGTTRTIMQNQGELRIKCSIASGLNTDFDKGNQEIEITSLADFSSVLLFWSATGVRCSKYKE